MTEYTAQQIATLQSRLEKQLGPEYISSRAGPSGQRVHYVAAEKCIALANDIFGFNGWSSSIQNITVDFVDEHPQTMRVSLGLSVIVRVSLRDGTYHEDLGYGHIENCKGKAAAFEKAKKEGTTDALKRALRNFGNVLGNCIYDKDYLSKVTKIKPPPTKFNEANLHRHQDFVKKEVKEEVKPEREVKPVSAPKEEPRALGDIELFSDDFGGMYYSFLSPLPEVTNDVLTRADLDDADFVMVEEGHPDEVVLGATNNSSVPAPPPRTTAPVNQAPQTPNNVSRYAAQAPGPAAASRPSGPQGHHAQPPNARPNDLGLNTPNVAAEPVGFFSARAVNKEIPESSLAGEGLVPKAQQMFNPKAESPSIRRTPGIDRNSSKPILKSTLQAQGSQSGLPPGSGLGSRPPVGSQAGRGNVVNPHMDQTRRIGAPNAGVSPLANRSQYKPPTMKRPLPGGGPAQGRPALAEMSTNGDVAEGAAQNGLDTKRQKTT